MDLLQEVIIPADRIRVIQNCSYKRVSFDKPIPAKMPHVSGCTKYVAWPHGVAF